MRCSQFRLRRGAALVDVLAVVGVVTLLTPVVMACLVDEREEARIGQCLANLRTLGVANEMYLGDWDGNFPVIVHGDSTIGLCSWLYGGKTADDYWEGYSGGVFYVPATERPLNPYLLGGRVEADLTDGGEVIKRTEVPMLKCPSDQTSHQRRFSSSTGAGISAYDDVGTSYLVNLHAVEDTNVDEWQNDGQGWSELARSALATTAQRQPDSFIWFMEEPLDWGLHDRIHVIGNHEEISRHSVGFRDGHAEYLFVDSHFWCGSGWEAINTAWQWGPNIERGAVFYILLTKDCQP